MLRGVLGAAAVVVASACTPAPPEDPAEALGCHVMLRFASEAERRPFLERNVEMIVAQASSAGLYAASSPDTPEYSFRTSSSCEAFDANEAGLSMGGAEVVSTTDRTFEAATNAIREAYGNPPAWTETATHQCVARVLPSTNAVGRLMNGMALSGLRNGSVHGEGGMMFGVYDEPCSLVRPFVLEAITAAGNRTTISTYCSDASLAQCGYGGALAVTPAPQ
jgi:hypothetical protein